MKPSLRLVFAVLMLLWAGCGEFLDLPPPNPGRACTQDSDCVPNGCCGMGTAAIHRADAQACTQAVCSGMCPENQVSCGCGVPICRDSRCTVAVATGPGCE